MSDNQTQITFDAVVNGDRIQVTGAENFRLDLSTGEARQLARTILAALDAPEDAPTYQKPLG